MTNSTPMTSHLQGYIVSVRYINGTEKYGVINSIHSNGIFLTDQDNVNKFLPWYQIEEIVELDMDDAQQIVNDIKDAAKRAISPLDPTQ